MSCLPFEEQAALALAPSFRERFDFSDEEQYKKFAEQTWKAAKALADHRPVRSIPSQAAELPAEPKKGAAK